MQAMDWLNLDYDEGPIFQSDRTARYLEVIQTLVKEGKAYRCTCSIERLDAMRERQMQQGEKPKYDAHCRDLHLDEHCGDHVIRFKNPLEGDVTFIDQVKGEITVSNQELDDMIIARTDGSPTYNFTVVVDDADMGITHVVRGDDHVNNTPRQIQIFNALGVTPPTYGHVPTILGSDGKRLSKRHGAASVMDFKKKGILPEALNNYLLRLGWSYGDQEIFSREEMIKLFDPSRLSRSAASFDENKLLWLNQHYIKQLSPEKLKENVIAFLPDDLKEKANVWPSDHWALLAPLLQERCQTLQECAAKSEMFFQDDVIYDEDAKKAFLIDENKPIFNAVLEGLNVSHWNKESIHAVFASVAQKLDLKLGKVAQPLRVAVTGGTVSPSLDITVYLLGRDKVLSALKKIVDTSSNLYC
jgi:glutamyl-tRNA synthetase